MRVLVQVLVAATLPEQRRAVVKVLARLDLLQAVPLARHLGQRLLDEFAEGTRILDALEDLPVALLHAALQSLEVRVLHYCLREGRTLHTNHEDRGSNREHVGLLTVVLWLSRQSTQFGLYLRTVIDRIVVLLRMLLFVRVDSKCPRLHRKPLLLLSHLLLGLVHVYVVVPDLRCVVTLRANVLPPVDLWIVFALE